MLLLLYLITEWQLWYSLRLLGALNMVITDGNLLATVLRCIKYLASCPSCPRKMPSSWLRSRVLHAASYLQHSCARARTWGRQKRNAKNNIPGVHREVPMKVRRRYSLGITSIST